MTTHIRFSSDERVPEGLYERTVEAIGRARTRAARIRIAISSFFITISGLGSALAVRATFDAARTSGFTSFASLALTDTSTVTQHAKEFLLSLVETLPGIEVAVTLLGLSVFLVSLRTLVRALSRTAMPASSHSFTSHHITHV